MCEVESFMQAITTPLCTGKKGSMKKAGFDPAFGLAYPVRAVDQIPKRDLMNIFKGCTCV